MANDAVMSTNDDASQGKRYAVHQGYWQDNFIQHFVKHLPERKAPEISRGYFIRNFKVRNIVSQFLSTTKRDCQIVNLGAGFDTLYWNLLEAHNLPLKGVYELDLKPIVQKKSFLIRSNPQLRNSIINGKIDVQGALISSELYHLIAVDITDVEQMRISLLKAGIQYDIPTLFLAECLFVYLPHEHTQKILKYIANEFQTVMFVDYDPVNLNDRFGVVMQQNLRGRQCNLAGAHASLTSKKAIYACFTEVQAKLVSDIYMDLPSSEKQRVEKIEFLDEIDLLYELLRHYCICVAYKQTVGLRLDNITL